MLSLEEPDFESLALFDATRRHRTRSRVADNCFISERWRYFPEKAHNDT